MAIATDPQLEAFLAAFEDFVRAAKRARTRVEPDDALTLSQLDLLSPLLHAPESLTLGALARAAGVAPPTATRMADGLQARGLLRREPCAEDRRAVRLSLTPAGEAAVERQLARIVDRRRGIFQALTPEERRAASTLLGRMAAAYEGLDD